MHIANGVGVNRMADVTTLVDARLHLRSKALCVKRKVHHRLLSIRCAATVLTHAVRTSEFHLLTLELGLNALAIGRVTD